jgi:hypothetical protein
MTRLPRRKIAVDIHGVIDQDPDFFRDFLQTLRNANWEVHILTGKHIKNGIMQELKRLGIARYDHYTHLFSISDYHKKKGTKMWGDEKNPWMDDTVWSATKAEYCVKNDIDLCIDDTDRYLPYFITGVARYYKTGLQISEKKV